MSKRFDEIKQDFRIHKELAPSQITYLIARVEKLEAALKKIASCASVIEGDCPSIAHKVLHEEEP